MAENTKEVKVIENPTEKRFPDDVIIFSEKKSISEMSDTELTTFLDSRYDDMSSAEIRKVNEKFWDEADNQFTALTVRDIYNNLKVNIPLEQDLIDTYEGRAAWKIPIDIQPNGKQANVDELQPAQYAVEYYLEGWDNNNNGFYNEAPTIRRQKARYGTEFTLTGLENTSELMYKIKDNAIINDAWDLENPDNYESYIKDSYEFFPKHINIRSVFIDEKALWQPNVQKANDMFIEMSVSLDKIMFERGNKKWYNDIDKLGENTQNEYTKKNKLEFAKNQTIIRWYFNKLSKDYVIYAPNEKVIIHKSKMLYNHGLLPIDAVQHYSDETCLYGIGIPRKVKYLKAYKSEILQAILDNAAMGSGLNFIIWNDGKIENRNLGWEWVNVRRSSEWAENIKQMQPQMNSWLVSILQVLDDLVIQDTGENVRASIDANSDKVGIVEIMEENKAIRHKSVDENWNIYLDNALTKMLSNIVQFVPTLLSRVVEIEQGEETITKIQYPFIKIENAKVTQTTKWIKIDKEDNYGKLWYFEFKPWIIPYGLWVKVVTPSTVSTLPMIKKDAITKWIDGKLKMAQIAVLDTSGKMMEQLRSSVNMEELNQWINDVYGFEDKLKSMTGKDKIKELNLKKAKLLQEKLSIWTNLIPQQQQNVWPTTWTPVTSETTKAPIAPQNEGLQNPTAPESM